MEKPFSDDVSVNVLRRMKEGGFDFAPHPSHRLLRHLSQ